MSKNMKRAYDYAIEKDKTLTGDSFTPHKCVLILQEDGGFFNFVSAFIEKVRVEKDVYIIVYSEHNGTQIFAEDELLEWAEYSKSAPPTLTVTL